MKSERWRFALPSIIASILSKASLADLGILCSRVSTAQESHCIQDKHKGFIDTVWWGEGTSARQLTLAAPANGSKLENTCNCHICGDFWGRKSCGEHQPPVSNFPCQHSMPYSELLNTLKGPGQWPPARLGKPAESSREEVNVVGVFYDQSAFFFFLEKCL